MKVKNKGHTYEHLLVLILTWLSFSYEFELSGSMTIILLVSLLNFLLS